MEFKKFVLVTVYVPNAGQCMKRIDYRIKEWDPDFFAYLKLLEISKSKPVLLCGDLNVTSGDIDVYDGLTNDYMPGLSTEERESFNQRIAQDFIDTYRYLHPRK